MKANGYRKVLSLKMFGQGLPMMLKEYGLNHEKRNIKQEIQTNPSLKEAVSYTHLTLPTKA